MISIHETTQEIINTQQRIQHERNAQKRARRDADNYGGGLGTVTGIVFFICSFASLVLINPHSSILFGAGIVFLVVCAIFLTAYLSMIVEERFYRNNGSSHEHNLLQEKQKMKDLLSAHALHHYGISLEDSNTPNELDQVVLLALNEQIREVKFVQHEEKIALLSQGVELPHL